MSLKIFYTFLTFLFLQPAQLLDAQNLVPNPSFEQYSSCPVFASQLNLASPWFNPTLGTPEFFHGCAAVSSWVSVPSQATGGYQPARTGVGYAGIYILRTDIPQMREYIEIELIEPLTEGRCYHFEMFVNQPNDHSLVSDGIGAYLVKGELRLPTASVIPVSPQFSNPLGNLITDTAGWTLVSGNYTAAGGEDHLVIGNFKDDNNTLYQVFNNNVWYTNSAYLLVDDVSLSEITLSVDLGNDTSLCRGQQLLLDAGNTGDSWLWNDGSINPTFLVEKEGTYWVEAREGGCKARDTIHIDFLDKPPVLLGEDTVLCTGELIGLDVSVWGANYLWDNNSTDPYRLITEKGTYSVYVYNNCGGNTGHITVDYKDCYCEITVATVFTPNDDGFNDVFLPAIDCRISRYLLKIYNRWGTQVYESKQAEIGWNGKRNNEKAAEGVYFWLISFMGNDNGNMISKTRSGVVHLIR